MVTLARHWPSSTDLVAAVRAQHDTVLLSFSAGKDAIASWLVLREAGFAIVPYYLELIPGLEFVDQGLDYFERVFGAPIRRIPSPSLFRMLRNLTFQPPERCRDIERMRFPAVQYHDIEAKIRREHKGAPIALGTRAADSPMRRAAVVKHGAYNPKRHTFLPIYDWSTKATYARIADAGIELPVDYEMFGRSFDGIDHRFLAPIRERFPRDYARIIDWFPLADAEFKRRTLWPADPQ